MPRIAEPPGPGPDGSAALRSPALDRAHRHGLLVRCAVWAAVAAGPVALLASCASSPSPRPAAHAAPSVALAGPGADPAGFAQMFLSLWLRSDSADTDAQTSALRTMAPGVDLLTNAHSTQAAQSPRAVAQTVVIRSAQIQPGYWSVVVAAEIASGSTAQVRYFAVPVQVASVGGAGDLASMAVLAAPAEVAAPVSGGVAQTLYAGEAAPGSALVQAVTGFLQAYLSGSGEIAPLLAPGAQVAALSAAPYAQVQVLDVAVDRDGLDGPVPADGTFAQVWVQVTATDPAGTRWPLRYALRMRARAGRWEVAALGPGPLLADAQHSRAPAPSAHPSSP